MNAKKSLYLMPSLTIGLVGVWLLISSTAPRPCVSTAALAAVEGPSFPQPSSIVIGGSKGACEPIVDVSITGNPDDRAFVIQPVAYTGPNINVGQAGASTDGYIGRVVLVR